MNDLVISAGKTGVMSFHNRQMNFLVKPEVSFDKMNLDYTAETKIILGGIGGRINYENT
jgi:hypothetical protein